MQKKQDTETKLYAWLKKKIPGAQFQRIETSTTAGVPDVYLCHCGWSIWVELKIVQGKQVLLRKEQYAWGHRHAKHGGDAVVLARKGTDLYLWRFPNVEVEPRGSKLLITSDEYGYYDTLTDPRSVIDFIRGL